jgi:hypothetical protein
MSGYIDLKHFSIYIDGKKVIGACPSCNNTGRKVVINDWVDIFGLSLTELKDLILKTKCDTCEGKGVICEE